MASGTAPRPFSLIAIGEPIVNEIITVDGYWHNVNFAFDTTALYYITFTKTANNNFTGVSKIVAGNILNATDVTNAIYFAYTIDNLSDLTKRVMIAKYYNGLGYYVGSQAFGSDTIKLVVYKIA